MNEILFLVLLALMGAAGTATRYGISLLYERTGKPAHYATLTVNLAGVFLLGAGAGAAAALPSDEGFRTYYLLGAGFLGGLTTFSTWMLQLVRMRQKRAYRLLSAYAAWTIGGGIPLAALGYVLGLGIAGA